MTPQEFRTYLKQQARAYGSQKAFARHCGIGEAILSDVIRGRRDPGPKMLLALGFARVVRYEQTDKAQEEER